MCLTFRWRGVVGHLLGNRRRVRIVSRLALWVGERLGIDSSKEFGRIGKFEG
jgi:hypothetical protein